MVIVSDATGTITEMNERAVAWFADRGGRELIGKRLLEVHKEPSQAKIRQMTEKRESNAYTVKKDGAKVLIYQSPWYVNGAFAGFVELGLEVPEEIPHHVRAPKAE